MQTSFPFPEPVKQPAIEPFSELVCFSDADTPYPACVLYRVWRKEEKRRVFFEVQVDTEAGSYDIARWKDGIRHKIEFDTLNGAKRYAERHAREHGRKELGPWSS